MRQLAETTGPCYLQSTHRSRYTYLCANISSPYCWFPVTLSPYFQLTMSTTRARHQHIHVPAQEHKQKPPKPPFRLRTRGCVWWCTFFRFFFLFASFPSPCCWSEEPKAKRKHMLQNEKFRSLLQKKRQDRGRGWRGMTRARRKDGGGIKTVRRPACQVKNFCKLYNSFLECIGWTHYHFAWRVACQAYTGAGPPKTPEIVGPWARDGDRAYDQSCVHTKAPVLEKKHNVIFADSDEWLTFKRFGNYII